MPSILLIEDQQGTQNNLSLDRNLISDGPFEQSIEVIKRALEQSLNGLTDLGRCPASCPRCRFHDLFAPTDRDQRMPWINPAQLSR